MLFRSDTSTPARPERVPQQSSVPEETEDVSTMMEAMSLSQLSNSNAAALSSVTATSDTQTLSGPQVRRKKKVCLFIV